MVNIFICYSHKDKDYLDELKQYFRDNPGINLWSDIALQAGDQWDNKIRQNLEVADIVILLISIDFFGSRYIKEVEFKIALENRSRNRNKRIIPIYTRRCPLKSPLALTVKSFQGFPRASVYGDVFLNETEDHIDSHYTDIYNGIVDIIETLNPADKDKENKDTIYINGTNDADSKNMMRDFYYATEGKQKYENWAFQIVPELLKQNEIREAERTKLILSSVYNIFIFSEEDIKNDTLQELKMALSKSTTEFSKTIIWIASVSVKEALLKSNLLTESQILAAMVLGTDPGKIFERIEAYECERAQKAIKAVKSEKIKTLMIYDFAKDHNNDFMAKIKACIENNNEKYSLRRTLPDHTVEGLREDLEKCHGAMIIYGNADTPWYLYRQALFNDYNILKAAICVSNPNIEDKLKFDVLRSEFRVITEDTEDLCGEINEFLEDLNNLQN